MHIATVIHARLPLRRPFRTARRLVTVRDVVFVRVESEGIDGWGEAVFWPGDLDEPPEAIWDGIVAGSPGVAGRAAVDEAEADLAARLAGVSLARHLGGRDAEVAMSLAIGLDEDPGRAATRAAASGYRAVKLKVEPGADRARVAQARSAVPGLVIGVDGNGSFPAGDEAPLIAMAAAGAAYVEQPYPVGSHAAHAALRIRLGVPLVLDEDVRSVDQAEEVIAVGAADVLVVKPAALGITGSLVVRDLAAAAGLAIKPSGFMESSIGRGHITALASLPGAVFADIAPAGAFLAADPVRSTAGGGIGLTIDDELIAPATVRRHDD